MSEAKVRVRVAHNAMHLPVVALRGLVVFPNNVVHFEVGRQKSIAAIEAAMHANSNIFLIAQKDMETEEPTAQDLYAYGVISEIKQVLRVSEDLVKVLVEGNPVPNCWTWMPVANTCRLMSAPLPCAVWHQISAPRPRRWFAA